WLMDHPKFYNNPLYITGDSYSGIIVPMVVQEISDGKLVIKMNMCHNESQMCEGIHSAHILEPSCTTIESPKSARSKWNGNYFSNKDSVNLLLSFLQLRRPWCRSYNYLFSYIWENDKLSKMLFIFRSLVYHENLIKQGYRVLVYSGDHDMDIPYVATMAWIESLNLTVDSPWKPWFVDGQIQSAVHIQKGAGHTAPEYKPEECHAMISRWFAYYPL
ncbi:hypothetical protein Prudu_777S000100, partial [Prunus dulcis]